MTCWCFVCQRDGVALRQYRDVYGQLREACADERACCDAHARRFPRKQRAPKGGEDVTKVAIRALEEYVK